MNFRGRNSVRLRDRKFLCAASCCAGFPDAVDVSPHEPDDRREETQLNNEMKAMEPLVETRVGMPRFAESHTHVGQGVTPGPRADECVEMEPQLRHFCDTGRKCYEGAHDWKQAAEKNGNGAVLLKEMRHPVKIVMAHQNPSTVAHHKRTPACCSDPISDHRPDIAANRAGSGGPQQVEAPRVDQVAGEGHNDFAGKWDTGGFDAHQSG